MKKKLVREMGKVRPNQRLLNEPQDMEDEDKSQTHDLEGEEDLPPGDGQEDMGNEVDVYGADDLDNADSLDNGESDMYSDDEGDSEVDLDSEVDFSDEDGDMSDDMSTMGDDSSPESLMTQLATVLAKILKSANPEMDDEEAVEEAIREVRKMALNEDAAIRSAMDKIAKMRVEKWDPSTFTDLSNILENASGDFASELKAENLGSVIDKMFFVVETYSEESGVHIYEVRDVLDSKNEVMRAKAFAEKQNHFFKEGLSKNIDNTEEGSNELLKSLKRQYLVLNGHSLRESLKEKTDRANHYVFASNKVKASLNISEESYTQGIGSKKGSGNQKALATRKTHSLGSNVGVVDPDDVLRAMDKATNAVSSRAPARRGDKHNARDKMEMIKDLARQASHNQIKAMWSSMYEGANINKISLDAIDYSFNTEVNALYNASESQLSESSKEQIKVVFENAVKDKLSEAMPAVVTYFESRYRKKLNKVQTSLVERLDSYLDYVVEEFMKDNKLAIEEGLAQEISGSFLEGLKSLFESHYVEVPNGKENVLETTKTENARLKEELELAKQKAVGFKNKAVKNFRENVANKVGKGLSENQQQKLLKMINDLEFNSEEELLSKARSLKDNFFGGKKRTPLKDQNEEYDTQLELTEDGSSSPHGSQMDKYLKTLRKLDNNK